MNPALKLKKLLSGPSHSSGRVVARDGTNIRVQTARGTVDAKATSPAFYRVNDSVLLKEGIVQGKIQEEAQVPVYYV